MNTPTEYAANAHKLGLITLEELSRVVMVDGDGVLYLAIPEGIIDGTTVCYECIDTADRFYEKMGDNI